MFLYSTNNLGSFSCNNSYKFSLIYNTNLKHYSGFGGSFFKPLFLKNNIYLNFFQENLPSDKRIHDKVYNEKVLLSFIKSSNIVFTSNKKLIQPLLLTKSVFNGSFTKFVLYRKSKTKFSSLVITKENFIYFINNYFILILKGKLNNIFLFTNTFLVLINFLFTKYFFIQFFYSKTIPFFYGVFFKALFSSIAPNVEFFLKKLFFSYFSVTSNYLTNKNFIVAFPITSTEFFNYNNVVHFLLNQPHLGNKKTFQSSSKFLFDDFLRFVINSFCSIDFVANPNSFYFNLKNSKFLAVLLSTIENFRQAPELSSLSSTLDLDLNVTKGFKNLDLLKDNDIFFNSFYTNFNSFYFSVKNDSNYSHVNYFSFYLSKFVQQILRKGLILKSFSFVNSFLLLIKRQELLSGNLNYLSDAFSDILPNIQLTNKSVGRRGKRSVIVPKLLYTDRRIPKALIPFVRYSRSLSSNNFSSKLFIEFTDLLSGKGSTYKSFVDIYKASLTNLQFSQSMLRSFNFEYQSRLNPSSVRVVRDRVRLRSDLMFF